MGGNNMRKSKAIEELTGIYSPANMETIKGFLARCDIQISVDRKRTYLTNIKFWGKFITKDFKDLSKPDIEKMIAEMNNSKTRDGEEFAGWTKRGMILTLRKIIQFSHGFDWDSQEFPDSVK